MLLFDKKHVEDEGNIKIKKIFLKTFWKWSDEKHEDKTLLFI